jgi:hypothetical protein
MAMKSSISINDYLVEQKKNYTGIKYSKKRSKPNQPKPGGKKHKLSGLLDDACELTGYDRKYITRLFNSRSKPKHTGFANKDGRGRKATYVGSDFMLALSLCHKANNYSCAELLAPQLKYLAPRLVELGELVCSEATLLLLCKVSISTVRRKLDNVKSTTKIHGISTTRSGPLLKSQIPIRKGLWDEDRVGFFETDTVAHCGEFNEGQYVHSYDFVDIVSGWSEQYATMGISELMTKQAVEDVRARLPFKMLGLDSDNGTEFINGMLYKYCKDTDIVFTRSRSRKKNDNAHVEQKNNTAIRKIIGYGRYDTDEHLRLINELYRGPLRLYLNYFQASRKRKIKNKDPVTGKVAKFYFDARTPYHRLLEDKSIKPEIKKMLQWEYNKLNPVKLLSHINTIIEKLDRSLR